MHNHTRNHVHKQYKSYVQSALTTAASHEAASGAAESRGTSGARPGGPWVHTPVVHDALQAEAARASCIVLGQRGVVFVIVTFIFLHAAARV